MLGWQPHNDLELWGVPSRAPMQLPVVIFAWGAQDVCCGNWWCWVCLAARCSLRYTCNMNVPIFYGELRAQTWEEIDSKFRSKRAWWGVRAASQTRFRV